MELEEGDSTVLEFECDGAPVENGEFHFKWYKDGINVSQYSFLSIFQQLQISFQTFL